MQEKNSKIKKYYWDKLIEEVKDKNEPKTTFYYLPRTPTLYSQKPPSKVVTYPIEEHKVHYSIEPNKNATRNRYQLSEPFAHIYLTQREADAVTSVLHYKTLSAAASTLGLSPRTIEFYFDNVKKKLNLRKKKEILEIFRKYDLLS